MSPRIGALAASLLLLSGCLFAVPGTQVSAGGLGELGAMTRPSAHLTVGAHTASFFKDATPAFDLGAGYVHDFSRWDGDTEGAYLSGAALLPLAPSLRLGVGPRFEYLHAWGHAEDGVGGAVRVELERYSPVDEENDSPGGNLLYFRDRGTFGVGLFVELGYRRWMRSGDAWFAVAGLSLRLPPAWWISLPLPD